MVGPKVHEQEHVVGIISDNMHPYTSNFFIEILLLETVPIVFINNSSVTYFIFMKVFSLKSFQYDKFNTQVYATVEILCSDMQCHDILSSNHLCKCFGCHYKEG